MLKVTNENKGICSIIHDAVVNHVISYTEAIELNKEMHKFLEAKGWHSDSKIFPISHREMRADIAYESCRKWNILTEYGNRRRATFAHLNKYLEELRNA